LLTTALPIVCKQTAAGIHHPIPYHNAAKNKQIVTNCCKYTRRYLQPEDNGSHLTINSWPSPAHLRIESFALAECDWVTSFPWAATSRWPTSPRVGTTSYTFRAPKLALPKAVESCAYKYCIFADRIHVRECN